MSARGLIRPDLRAFAGYLSARKQNGAAAVMLNANEAALPQPFDDQDLHRYPEPQPQALRPWRFWRLRRLPTTCRISGARCWCASWQRGMRGMSMG